jgi:hypothetical protein
MPFSTNKQLRDLNSKVNRQKAKIKELESTVSRHKVKLITNQTTNNNNTTKEQENNSKIQPFMWSPRDFQYKNENEQYHWLNDDQSRGLDYDHSWNKIVSKNPIFKHKPPQNFIPKTDCKFWLTCGGMLGLGILIGKFF